MMQLFQQSEATAALRILYLYLVDATDGITAETGEDGGQPQIDKVGGGFGNTSDTLHTLGSGHYYVTLTAAELGTLGAIRVRYKSANTAEAYADGQVVAYDAYDVKAEVVDALNVDTYAEPGQEAPGATVSLAKKIGYLYKAWRNKRTQTATTESIFADDAITVDQKRTVSDDGTTATKGEIASGP